MLLVVDGTKAIKEYEKEFKKTAREYKKLFKGWGVTYKQVKPKNAKKPYYYWYRWEYDADTQNNKWTYIGKEKPSLDIPDPPVSKLEEIEYTIAGSNVLISERELVKAEDMFEGYQKFEVNAS